MLPRADAGGLQASTVTYFVLSVSCAIRDHSCSEVSVAPRLTASRQDCEGARPRRVAVVGVVCTSTLASNRCNPLPYSSGLPISTPTRIPIWPIRDRVLCSARRSFDASVNGSCAPLKKIPAAAQTSAPDYSIALMGMSGRKRKQSLKKSSDVQCCRETPGAKPKKSIRLQSKWRVSS